VGHDGRALGATGPFRGPLRRVATFSTSQRGWASLAVDRLLNFSDVVVDGVYVTARSLNPRISVWHQLRQRLAAHGIRTPIEMPDPPMSADEWRAMRFGHPYPAGMTGCAR
jgi:hypothetical protein